MEEKKLYKKIKHWLIYIPFISEWHEKRRIFIIHKFHIKYTSFEIFSGLTKTITRCYALFISNRWTKGFISTKNVYIKTLYRYIHLKIGTLGTAK